MNRAQRRAIKRGKPLMQNRDPQLVTRLLTERVKGMTERVVGLEIDLDVVETLGGSEGEAEEIRRQLAQATRGLNEYQRRLDEISNIGLKGTPEAPAIDPQEVPA